MRSKKRQTKVTLYIGDKKIGAYDSVGNIESVKRHMTKIFFAFCNTYGHEWKKESFAIEYQKLEA